MTARGCAVRSPASRSERHQARPDADRVAALREAFAATLGDPDFAAEALRQQLEIEPMSGQEIATMLAKAYAAPKAIVERAAELVYPSAPH